MKDLKTQNEKQNYEDFKLAFKDICATNCQMYLYPIKSNNYAPIREQIINAYLSKHKRAKLCDRTITKALSLEAKRLLDKLPADFQPIATRIVQKRATKYKNGNQGLSALNDCYQSNILFLHKYLGVIAQYYVISTDIVEIKHWKKRALILPDAYELFDCSIRGFAVIEWHTRLKSFVNTIRFKNEWFALYYAMRDDLKPQAKHAFARTMNKWFPQLSVKCSYDSIADYTYLCSYKPNEWLTTPIETKSKATMTGVKRIFDALQKFQSQVATYDGEHFLMR